MRIPMKVDYGVRALVELAQSQRDHPIQAAEIASRQSIPEPYLDQLLTTLSKFGFVRSRRGPQGGHMLARPPEEITLDMIMHTLEGTTALLDCIHEPQECSLSNACAQREVWRSVEEAFQKVLSSTTVGDLAKRQRQLAGQIV